MAKKPTDVIYSPPAMDYAEHEATWNGFISLVKWSIVALAILVVFLYVVIRP
jgi:hypothetical protein